MSTETTCPNPECRRTYTLDDRLAGRTARCRHCQTCFEVRLGEGELIKLEIASNAHRSSHTAKFVPPGSMPSAANDPARVIESKPVPIRQRLASVPRRVADVIDAALRERPRIGFQTSAEFCRASQEAL